ncbi:MAG: 16S rRNA (guanine(527)-N(7))-methyltransferase RsmG [Rhodobacteraceae bacterium]|nr:16S rRNA (guanine(527)-N(7))-methyltransferase RsmG [Paracoccaceae bacterium]MYE36595.1 16S rRNA (guanine(527)-N(7))-methyltransferase RsmG [Paracoccaceae bacterium]MYG43092.1 16S rRNA (guanine(527)-N(7))-methyltransferase RsmG [Paracoccaceae bacterium]
MSARTTPNNGFANPFSFVEGKSERSAESMGLPIREDPRSFLKQHLSPVTFDKLNQYHDLLVKWNKRKQLVSITTLESLWLRHFLDSAQLYSLYPDGIRYKWMDIGSGGGFPGLVLACIASEYAPENEFVLVESNNYKAEFLKHVALKLGLNAIVQRSRVEDLTPQNANIVSARAVTTLTTLIQWSEKHLAEDGKALFLKGKNVSNELLEAFEEWDFDHAKKASWTDQTGSVLIVENIRKKG